MSEDARSTVCAWRMLAALLFCLLSLIAPAQSARAEHIELINNHPIVTTGPNPATFAPEGHSGLITLVRVVLRDIFVPAPYVTDDLDILLVGPGGQSAILMSDCGGANTITADYPTLVFSDGGHVLLPDEGQISSGIYRPTNYGGPTDVFPPNAARSYSTSLAVFNDTSPNGTWSLHLANDHTFGGAEGRIDWTRPHEFVPTALTEPPAILSGWTLEIFTTGFSSDPISIPTVGMANPYPSQIDVSDVFGLIRKMRVTLRGVTHSHPSDLDMMLVGPLQHNAVIMSDVGGTTFADHVTLTLDDDAPDFLSGLSPLVSGTYKPTNLDGPDEFVAPAPSPKGGSALSIFSGTIPDGTWSLYVVDDQSELFQTSGFQGWDLEFDLDPGSLGNISTRLPVETGDNVLIGGFIVTGTQAKKVIVRALGPSLPLAGTLADPILELRDESGMLIQSNDNWRSDQETEILATGIPPTNDLESAIVATLPAGNSSYTAIVRGVNGGTGIGLVEVYDLDRTVDSKLGNISTRGLVGTGDNALIAGTIVLGGFSERVMVRAIGPSLQLDGKLADPILELRDESGALVASNDNWRDNQEADVLLSTIPPSDDLESAIVATLPSGGASYTAVVRGAGGMTGVAVVEVYALN